MGAFVTAYYVGRRKIIDPFYEVKSDEETFEKFRNDVMIKYRIDFDDPPDSTYRIHKGINGCPLAYLRIAPNIIQFGTEVEPDIEIPSK